MQEALPRPEQEQSGCDGTNTGASKPSTMAPNLPSMAEPHALEQDKRMMGLINWGQQPGEPDGKSILPQAVFACLWLRK